MPYLDFINIHHFFFPFFLFITYKSEIRTIKITFFFKSLFLNSYIMLKDSIFEQTRSNADIKTSPIQPPITPSSSLTTSSSKYSLFEFSPASQILKDYPEFELFRKHSINGDNADFIRDKTFALSPSYDTPTFLARRASAPNHTIINVCSKCSSKHQPLSLSICGQHQFCHSCQRTKECSVCPKVSFEEKLVLVY